MKVETSNGTEETRNLRETGNGRGKQELGGRIILREREEEGKKGEE